MSPQAEIAWSADGRPRSARFDDIYFTHDGLAESRTVFLRGCGLPEAWRGRRRFVVAELGFGTGLNVLALLQLWRETRPPNGRLHVFSLDAHPLSSADAARALSAFPEVADLAAPLLERWPGGARGFERWEWPELGVMLDVATAEVADGLRRWSGQADAWFLDGFAPSRNPEMWRPEVLDLVRERSGPAARLATFTVAGAVRRGLEERGWRLTRAPGHGNKLERLEARLPGPPTAEAQPAPTVEVLGAGIAGAALARAFTRLGAACTVVDPRPGSGASGNPAALASARIDAGDGPAARLYAQAFARAAEAYRTDAPGAVIREGALRLRRGPGDQARFAALSASEAFRAKTLAHLDAASASAVLGAPTEASLWMAGALTLDPSRILDAWLQDTPPQPQGGGADIICIASGLDAREWLAPCTLEPVRGQATWSERVTLPGAAVNWGGYAIPLPGGGVLFGATHQRGSEMVQTLPEDDEANLAALAARLPELAAQAAAGPLGARAGVRAAAPDRLPLAGAVPGRPGLFVLTGLGGRGFTTAPLLAEHVAALALGAPSPLPSDLAAAVDPARFEERARRKASR